MNTYLILDLLIEQRENSFVMELSYYANKNIPEDTIIITDPRIYDGVNAWIFNEKHYLLGVDLLKLFEFIDASKGNDFELRKHPIFYLECVEGSYCGWKPEQYDKIYRRSKELTEYLITEKVKLVNEIRSDHNINVYVGELELPSFVYDYIDKGKFFLEYPIGWKNTDEVLDNYEAKGIYKVLNWFGFLILYLDVLITILIIPYIIYQIYWKKST